MEQRKKVVLDILERICNIQFQKDVWVNHLYNDVIFCFGEAVNMLDDYFFFDDIKEGKIKFSDPIDQDRLEDFASNILAYDDPPNINIMLNDTKWNKICEDAYILVNSLKEIDF